MGAPAVARFEQRFGPTVPFGSRRLLVQHPPLGGTDVAVFQALAQTLRALLDRPPPSRIAISGVFDPACGDAACELQRHFRLAGDGVVGPSTYFALGHGVGPYVTYGGPAFGERTLHTGAEGGDAYVLHNRLALFQYARLLGRPADGCYRPATAVALAAFCADASTCGDPGLPTGPDADQEHQNALLVLAPAGGRALFTGRNGLDVAYLQIRLRHLGTYPGRIDGYCGPLTVTAIRHLQSACGLTQDGIAGAEVFYTLGRMDPHPAPWPAPVPDLG